MIHLNGNLLCVIDTETTGLKAGYHDIIQVCIMPLDFNMEVHQRHMPFEMKLKPRRPENIDFKSMSVNRATMADIATRGMDPDRAADLFDEWFSKLRLPEGKRLSPLAHNWAFDAPFMKDWLGNENFEARIDGRYRDTMSTALFLNDWADSMVEQIPFPKVNLRYLCTTLGIDMDESCAHDALYDCMKTAEVYRKLVKHFRNLI